MRVTSKGQVTIPRDLRELAGIEPNSEVIFTIEDGKLVCFGPRGHLFYVGDEKPFVNFELRVDCKTEKNSNGGIYFHTKFQEQGWPKYGFEAQVNNSYNADPQKTGSLYAVVKVLDKNADDDDKHDHVHHMKARSFQRGILAKLCHCNLDRR